MSDLSSLSGDGINFSFFNLLWSKSSNASGKEDGNKQDGAKQRTNNKKSPILRVPDTVRKWIGHLNSFVCFSLAIHMGLFSTIFYHHIKGDIPLWSTSSVVFYEQEWRTQQGQDYHSPQTKYQPHLGKHWRSIPRQGCQWYSTWRGWRWWRSGLLYQLTKWWRRRRSSWAACKFGCSQCNCRRWWYIL